ncbi:MAG: hypothetical protein IGS50_13015 [Synechococcales cyanobacterium C42_A2020_086]|nr:hypothetical protein [Synechococcales cyanobacterium C42_A2020_086]
MNLDQQIQQLIDQSSRYGVPPEAVQAIAPVLKAIASQLQHPQYYIPQHLDQGWLMTTLQNRTQPELSKNVVYAFPSLSAVKASSPNPDPQIVALPVPVVHILFQMLAMKPIDSIIFVETAENLKSGVEVRRQDIQTLLQQALQTLQPNRLGPPADFA